MVDGGGEVGVLGSGHGVAEHPILRCIRGQQRSDNWPDGVVEAVVGLGECGREAGVVVEAGAQEVRQNRQHLHPVFEL